MYDDLILCFGKNNVKWVGSRNYEVTWGDEVHTVTRSVVGSTVWVDNKYSYCDVFTLADDLTMGLMEE